MRHDGGGSGDGDGFSTLTDCDNEQVDEALAPPELDGYSTLECEQAECYECPEEPPPWAPTEGGRGSDGEFDSCSGKGCAMPFGGMMWLPIGLAFRRRRSCSRRPDPTLDRGSCSRSSASVSSV